MSKPTIIDIKNFAIAIKDLKNKIANKVPMTRKINGKELSSDIIIGPNDISSTKIVYATCSTASDTQVKEIILDDNNIELKDGDIIAIKFINSNTFNCSSTNGYVTFKIDENNYSIYDNNSKYRNNGTTNELYGKKNYYIFYKVDVTNKGLYQLFHPWDSNTTYTNWSLGQGYTVCSSAASTLEKVASASYTLSNGGVLVIKFDHSVPDNATLNINNKGAKPIYHMGTPIKSKVIIAGDIAVFMYNGTQYSLLTIDRHIIPPITIPASGWVSSGDVYTNKVIVAGLTTEIPIDVYLYNEANASDAEIDAYDSLITDINILDTKVTFTAKSKPTVDITVSLKRC